VKLAIVLSLVCSFGIGTVAADDTELDKVNRVIDQLHQYASHAQSKEYFELFAENAVFIGTDAQEIWSKQAFQKYAQPHFSKGKGWTYTAHNRHVYFAAVGNIAWFDEMLSNASLGVTRGTGVLEKVNQQWKITQYHLTIPIPNGLADDIVKMIRQHQ